MGSLQARFYLTPLGYVGLCEVFTDKPETIDILEENIQCVTT